jgi:hypothetical protein
VHVGGRRDCAFYTPFDVRHFIAHDRQQVGEWRFVAFGPVDLAAHALTLGLVVLLSHFTSRHWL